MSVHYLVFRWNIFNHRPKHIHTGALVDDGGKDGAEVKLDGLEEGADEGDIDSESVVPISLGACVGINVTGSSVGLLDGSIAVVGKAVVGSLDGSAVVG